MSIDFSQLKKVWLYKISTHFCLDSMGCYIKNNLQESLTPYQEGYNACLMEIEKEKTEVYKLLKKLPDDILEKIFLNKLLVLSVKNKYSIYINCNDLFYWACSDAEELNEEDYDAYRFALKQSEKYGDLLFACRKRNMRPQKAFYKSLTKEEKKLFDESGPSRDE